ncbi:SAICAR synthetase [Fomitiporia mediterranea MF3/22]|uniref:SAICAR synthetase n=1 Tax=Fomitiporia mediterranea (strain MF3/22) TaxID=694068 RepID=UPI0004408DBF|nr:SAICAR synthetase [Fomitiporia mediterranea MF3/22]EJD07355.1 SAICAR synthetase [Fomitiporia mediterranea MF3/22]
MPPPSEAVINTKIPETNTLKFISRWKVRDLYEIKDGENEFLLFVATDRISAFDVILKNGVPGKGALLTQLSVFWFNRLQHVLPNHLIASTLEDMPSGIQSQISPYWDRVLSGRTLLVRKAKVVKLEAIVRGYLTGSAWSEYKKSRTVHGIPLPEGLIESQKLPEPLFTPSTKAEQGEHDENISPEQAKQLLGEDLYTQISQSALALYAEASNYALSRGVILADTKFEFGLIPLPSSPSSSSSPSPSSPGSSSTAPTVKVTTPEGPHSLLLIDEALTPDSSRYWSLSTYKPGHPQPSFDKQYLRDWLLSSGFRKGLETGPTGKEGEGWEMTPEVIEGTQRRYAEVVKMLIG